MIGEKEIRDAIYLLKLDLATVQRNVNKVLDSRNTCKGSMMGPYNAIQETIEIQEHIKQLESLIGIETDDNFVYSEYKALILGASKEELDSSQNLQRHEDLIDFLLVVGIDNFFVTEIECEYRGKLEYLVFLYPKHDAVTMQNIQDIGDIATEKFGCSYVDFSNENQHKIQAPFESIIKCGCQYLINARFSKLSYIPKKKGFAELVKAEERRKKRELFKAQMANGGK